MQKKFKIEIWFDIVPKEIFLGSVFIYADTEQMALELAKVNVFFKLIEPKNI